MTESAALCQAKLPQPCIEYYEVIRVKWKMKWTLFYLLTIGAVLLGVHIGDRAVTVLSESLSRAGAVRIVIDPGHGGVDGGATSCTGNLESAYNLEIALRLNDLFRLLGYDTRMIRTEDISVYTKGETIAQKKVSDLKERVRIANESENTLLVSIHQNIFPDSQYSGAQVFYPATEGSKGLAESLQSAFVETLNPGSHRRAKKSSGIYLLEHIQCPGILVECGFLSNPREAALLDMPEYQQRVCCVIAAAVSSYLSNT